MITFTGEIHEYAEYWPLLSDDDLLSLAESIAEHGLKQPITLTPEGAIADGRNRLRGCELAGVEPRFTVDETLTDNDAVAAFIQAANAERHHISPGAHAMYRARLLQARGKRKNGRWERGSVVGSGNSSTTSDEIKSMSKAGLILDWCPEHAEKVVAGELALDTAHEIAKAVKDEATKDEREQERIKNSLKQLRDRRPDLADLVEAEKLTLVEAFLILKKDLEKEEETARLTRERDRKRNLNLHIGYAIWMSMRHPDIRREIEANYEVIDNDITGPVLKEFGEWLLELSDTWRNEP